MVVAVETGVRVLAAVVGVAFVVVAFRGHTRWTAHTAGRFGQLLLVLGGSALAFAIVVPSMALYQLVWLYTLLAVPTVFALFSFEYYGVDFLSTVRHRAVFASPAILGAAAGTVLSFDVNSMGAGGRFLSPVMREQMMSTGPMNTAAMQAPLATLLESQSISLPAWIATTALAIQELSIYYVSGLTLVASGVLVTAVARYRHLDTGLGVSLAFTGLWPWAAFGFMPIIADLLSWQTALVGIAGCYTLSLVAAGLVVGRYGLFESDPAAGNIGSSTVLNELTEPVFVLDRGENVLRINAAAETTFAIADEDVVGRPLKAAIGVDTADLQNEGSIDLETTEGRRQFETTCSPILGNGGTPRGETVVFRDVTQRETRRQRLQVLTRVLRHNLRNNMTVIRGQAELISDGGTADPEASADQIREMSDRLISISERAREAQKVVTSTGETGVQARVDTVVRAVHDDLADRYPDIELSTAVPDGTTAAADQRTLEIVLRNVVENACKHNDAESPIVVTSVDRTDEGTIRVTTRDNGPGIPEMERRVVEGGVENPLDHGTGMGLWTVKWGVTQMGGTLSFTDETPRGTVVQLELPAPDE
jgi:signal transduction histidine kinase